MLCASLHVRAMKLVILVKPIGIFTRFHEHLFQDKNSYVVKHLYCSRHCRFSQLEIKESFHIERLNPELDKQVEHVN